MKILEINSVCGVGSTGKIAVDLYSLAKQKGIECKVAYGRGNALNIPEEDTFKIGSKADYIAHGIGTRLTGRCGFFSKKATKEFIEKVEKYDPDVVHLHNIHGYYVNIELLFKYLKGADKKVVWTLHDCWSFTGHCSHFELTGCYKWKTKCCDCPNVRKYPQSYVDNSNDNYKRKKEIFTSITDMTISTPSDWLADLVRESFLNKYPIMTIPNGINTDVFKPTENRFKQEWGIEDKKMVLAVSGIWGKVKGFYDVIKLSEILDDNYKVVIVGLKEEQKKELPDNIIGITRTNSAEELAQIYTAADVFVNPTFQDTYPTVNLEAIACGTPVVTYNTGGSVESVDPRYIVEKGNVKALKEAVVKAVNDGFESYNTNVCLDKKIQFEKYFDIFSCK